MKTLPKKAKSAFFLTVGVFLTQAAFGATLQQASVTESFNTVSYQANAEAPQKAATTGTVIHPSNIVRTGVDSRAELQFNDMTITRMGANSVFSFDEKSQTMDLQQGSVLFSKPKNSDTFQISTPAATCSISGTTGFAEYVQPSTKVTTDHGTLLFGLIEGKTNVTINGKGYPVGGGQLLVSTGGSVRVLDFNLTSFLEKAALIRKFKSTLPNAHEIKKAADRYASLSKRGFIEPTRFSLAMDSNQLRLLESLNPGQNVQPNTQIANQVQTSMLFQQQVLQRTMGNGGGFVDVGGNGIIRGQLVWNVDVDLDLHLILPGGAGNVGFDNNPVNFNGGQATAKLDVDDTGPIINGPNGERVENIVITGVPSNGNYQFYGQYYGGEISPVTYTLTVTGNGGTTNQRITGTLTTPGGLEGQTTPILTVTHGSVSNPTVSGGTLALGSPGGATFTSAATTGATLTLLNHTGYTGSILTSNSNLLNQPHQGASVLTSNLNSLALAHP